MIKFEDVINYVKSLDPEYRFFKEGYVSSCPVAQYGKDILDLEDAVFDGSRLSSTRQEDIVAEPNLSVYVRKMEKKYNVEYYNVTDGSHPGVTARQFLEV